MRTTRRFWLTVATALALIILGYVGFVALMPDKTAGGVALPAFFLSYLMLWAGAIGLVSALVYALVKAASERKRGR